jgi:hypothetical protein
MDTDVRRTLMRYRMVSLLGLLTVLASIAAAKWSA